MKSKTSNTKTLLGTSSLVVLSMLVTSGCGAAKTTTTAASSGSSGKFTAPLLAPLVNKALPTGLQSSTTTTAATAYGEVRPGRLLAAFNAPSQPNPLLISKVLKNNNMFNDLRAVGSNPVHMRDVTPTNGPTAALAAEAAIMVKGIFTDYYANANGGFTQGYLNNLVLTFDSRLSGLNSQIAGNSTIPTCLSNTPTSTTIDMSAINDMLNFTSPYLQCLGAFGSSNTEGVAVGSSSGNYSIWLQLGSATPGTTYDQSGGFFGAANVINYGSTSAANPETVDGLLMSVGGTASGNSESIVIARFIASSTTGSFAMYVGSNEDLTAGESDITGASGTHDSYLGTGFRVVSDGTHIYSDGYMLNHGANSTTASGAVESNIYFYNICLNSSDLSMDNTPTDCSTLANSYATTAWATVYPGLDSNPNPLDNSPSLNFNAVTGCASTLPTYGDTSGVASTVPTNNACATGVGAPGDGPSTYPDATIYTALEPVQLPSTLPALYPSASH